MKRAEKSKATARRGAKPTSGRGAKPTAGKTRAAPTARKRRAWPTAGKANQRTATETRRSTRRNTLQRKAAASQSRSIQEPMQMSSLGEVWATIPTIDFNVETVKYKNQSFTVQKGHRGDPQRDRRRNEDQLLLGGEPVRIVGKTSTEGFVVKKHSERKPLSQLSS